MILKAKSDNPIKLIKDARNFATWRVPELDGGNAPSFHQPIEEEKESISEEEQAKITAKELQAIRDAAYEEGFQSGRNDGLTSGKQQIQEQAQHLSDLLEQLNEPLKVCGEKTQNQLLELSFAIARQIVRRELQQDPSQLIAIIREALKLLPIGSENIRIALHPEDAKVVTSALSINRDDAGVNWQIKSDPSVERGCCLVNTENSKIDASIDKQIAILFSRVAGGLRAGENDVE